MVTKKKYYITKSGDEVFISNYENKQTYKYIIKDSPIHINDVCRICGITQREALSAVQEELKNGKIKFEHGTFIVKEIDNDYNN